MPSASATKWFSVRSVPIRTTTSNKPKTIKKQATGSSQLAFQLPVFAYKKSRNRSLVTCRFLLN
jgi:hypothetical protein